MQRLAGGGSPRPGRRLRHTHPLQCPQLVTVTASDRLNVRRWGELDSPVIHTDPQGTTFWAERLRIGAAVAGEARWYIEAATGQTDDGRRHQRAGL